VAVKSIISSPLNSAFSLIGTSQSPLAPVSATTSLLSTISATGNIHSKNQLRGAFHFISNGDDTGIFGVKSNNTTGAHFTDSIVVTSSILLVSLSSIQGIDIQESNEGLVDAS